MPQRWSARAEAAKALYSFLVKTIDLFESMAEAGRDEENLDTRSKAAILLRAIQKYEFFASFEFCSRLLRLINIVQKTFQEVTMNIMEASDEL